MSNTGKTKFQGINKFICVEYDQTASHMHHALDFNIKLPNNFDMNYYNSLKPADKIAYAKKQLPYTVIISCRNEIAKTLTPVFNSNTESKVSMADR